jgi:Asp-tRNA(Asn)/Glu-tRNA(Gln) amidotransferase A subunit family amidase
VGPEGGEATLVAIAAAIEAAVGWSRRAPIA